MNLDIGTLMRLSDVRRWHTVRVAREQTLADHSCRVALLALRLYWLVTGETDNADMATLLATALVHDAAEIRLGDPPPAGKNRAWTETERGVMLSLPPELLQKQAQQHSIVHSIIKVADRVEAWLWIRENAVGKHSMQVVTRCFQEMERVAADYRLTAETQTLIEEITGERIELCPF